MVTRKLRINVPAGGQKIADIDSVTDPSLLAHRMLNLEGRAERRYFDHRLRMSTMHNVCVRGQLLGLRNNAVSVETIPVSLRVTFDIGNAIHLFLQNGGGYLGKNRIGWWQCLACGHKIFGRQPVAKCPRCGALEQAFQYVEHALHAPEGVPISGHIDGFLEVAPGDIRVIDFKTINGDDFADLDAPKPEHCIQVNGYMKYIQMDDTVPVKINPDRGLLLYISKKHSGRMLPFKMFHVRRKQMFLDVIEHKVAEFKHGLEDPTYLPEPLQACVASDFKSAACRSCNTYSYCVALRDK